MTLPKIYQAGPDGVWDGVTTLTAKADEYNEGEFLIPGRCVFTQPPTLSANQCAKLVGDSWTGYTQQWEVVADYRNLSYWDPVTREKVVIVEVGVVPPEGYLTSDPGPSLADQKADKVAACDSLLSGIDDKSRRSLREVTLAVIAGTTPDPVAVAKLTQYNTDAAALRTKRSAIVAATSQAQLDAVVL